MARDPKRIERILGKLEKVWREYPDLRLGQLVHHIHYSAGDVAYARRLLSVEDDVMEAGLGAFAKEHGVELDD